VSSLVISTTKIVKSFGKSIALNELDMQIPKGISGFIGKNGAGKTTTIGVLLGLLKPNSGKATVFGLDCWNDSFEIRQRLGVMHEVNTYPSNFTGKRFLEHIGKIYGITQIDQHINDILKDVGLVGAKDKPIKAYSAGMFKRLGLAQALMSDPEFAILDEPTANIDPLGRIALLEKIQAINKEHGTSFLISTHILSDLEKICHWLSIIDSGKVIAQGSVTELADRYSANVFKVKISNSKLFADKVAELPMIEKVWVEDEIVFCKVNNVDAFCEIVPALTVNLKLRLKGFQQMVGTLEEIYTRTASVSK
jgi:ABC-2 type transport system ATP-binding protein